MNNKWFTLVELIVVITILCSIAFISLSDYSNKNNTKEIDKLNILNSTEKLCFKKCDLIPWYIYECRKNCLIPNKIIWD